MQYSYKDLIREAFIDPIRSVAIIDDEYPTLSNLIAHHKGTKIHEKQIKQENLDRLQKIIAMCHEKRKWSVDVFDGQLPKLGNGTHFPSHLHHSDLIVLDYHLDGEQSNDDGTRARGILSELGKNNHFNIVLVHTKGFESDIEQVFNDILCDFIFLDEKKFFISESDFNKKIEDWLDENNIDDDKYQFTSNKLDLKDIIRVSEYDSEKEYTNIKNPSHILNNYRHEIEKLSEESNLDIQKIIKWLLGNQVISVVESLKSNEAQDVKWEWNNDTNFICTGRIFISVIRKGTEDPNKELYDRLCNSLYALDASPMFLLMAKIRHEIDECGFDQANNIINNRYAQSGWLFNLLNNAAENPSEHDKAIDLHWEQLGRASKKVLRDFSMKLVNVANSESEGNHSSFVKRFFKECINKKEQALGHLNAFSCSMPVMSRHLTTGTIFQVDGDMWVCISPACDLVPGQRIGHWKSRIGEDHLVFKAIKLASDIKLSTANNSVNTNEFIFLNIDGEIQALSITEGNKSPIWDTFYADNQGKFSKENTFSLTCIRQESIFEITKSEIKIEEKYTNLPKTKLMLTKTEATVVAELRYEYALNFLHKFGANQTRVGLGFINNIW
ncbi:hypothetical protein KKI93_00715 [Xenorhabdus bovienii]|nr:hypothetical protein [Xenorhabdus bovienii]